jgi:presequence protease
MMALNHGFELLKEEKINEINSLARLYRHVASGAELLSLINDDENKVFGITFRTPPADSSGVAHIMEHSVLCGSRKYPLKEPFVELVKGSLNTFLNAMTYPDKTTYPVASQNVQDFYNLVDVYLDAVFYPRIDPFTLKQEGWHYELDSPEGEMEYKGVVFNEMKGAYSSPEGVLDEAVQHALFPDNTYGLDSGGDPVHIPDLTYTAFKDFHDRYYHPANSRIFFYGDDDPEKRLELLDAYLKDFKKIQVDSQVALQPRFAAPHRAEVPYEVSEGGEEPKNLLTLAWLLPEGSDPNLVLGLAVLQEILIGSPASPLRKALIDSGLGEDLTGRGLETNARQLLYTVGMKGIQQENVPAVETLILNTLQDLAKNGIDPDTVAASLNTIEFGLREKNFGRYPRGLVVMLDALTAWIYDRDPIEGLRYDTPLAALKARLRQGERYFENLIGEYFLNNAHRVTVVLEPDAGLAQRRADAEKARLAAARQAMSPTEVEQVIADAAELHRRQELPDTPEALATIPTLKLSDLDPAVRTIPAETLRLGGAEVLYHDLFTNGILYLDLGFNLHNLPGDWLSYLPLFGRALTETGTQEQSFVQLLQRIGQQTGGIHPQLFISSAPGRKDSEAWMFLRGKSMVGQAGELLKIYDDVLRGARLDDRERFRQMALEEKASVESGLVHAGHRVINSRLKARFDEAGWANEQVGGLSYLFFLRELIGRIDQDWASVQARLEGIRDTLLNRESMLCNVTLDRAAWAAVQPALTDFLGALPAQKTAPQAWTLDASTQTEGLTIPAQINFVGLGGNIFEAGYSLKGSVLAIVNYINSTWIWEKVRVQGGAYGGFNTFDQHSGVMTFLSYRDPNVLSTLEAYKGTAAFLQNLDLSQSELTKSVIGAIGDLDAYQLPDAKGFTALVRRLLGISTEWRQQFRDELLTACPEDFRTLGQAMESMLQRSQVVVLGSAQAIQSANEQQPGMFDVRQVL